MLHIFICYLSIYLSIFHILLLPNYPIIYLSVYSFICPSRLFSCTLQLSRPQATYYIQLLSIYLFIHLFYPSIYLSIYLSRLYSSILLPVWTTNLSGFCTMSLCWQLRTTLGPVQMSNQSGSLGNYIYLLDIAELTKHI